MAVGSDKKIWSTSGEKSANAEAMLSTIVGLKNGKAFFCGVGEDERPGHIQIWKHTPLERINSNAAHGNAIERLRISYCNNRLFSCSRDGTLMMFEIRDQDPRGIAIRKKDTVYSEEILTEKTEMDTYDTMINSLQNDLIQVKDPQAHDREEKMSTKEDDELLAQLRDEDYTSSMRHNQQYEG